MRRLAARQYSVVTRAQLLEIGFGPRAIDRRVESGELRVLHRGVYLVGPVAPPLAREFAAVLACGDQAYLSHSSAGHLWSLTPYLPKTAPLHITVRQGDPRHPGIRVHRTRVLGSDEITHLERIPITTPARTLLDLAAELSSWQLERSVAEGLRRRLASHGALTALLTRHSGRRGVPALRRVLESGDPAFTRRELEARFLKLIRSANLPEPEVNARVGRYEVDFLWRTERLAIETDGWQYHSDRKAFEDDRRRDAELVASGYRVIRVTWRQLEESPAAVVATIAAALAIAA